jgi:hypothetical protein
MIDQKSRAHFHRQITEAAADRWDLFAGPVSKFMLVIQKFTTAKSGMLPPELGNYQIVEIVKW